MKVRFVIPRHSNDESTVAIVDAEVFLSKLSEPAGFRQALSKALTEWFLANPVGKREWESSHYTFNIGDLSQFFGPLGVPLEGSTLESYLAVQSIHDLKVTVFTANGPSGWSFDTILATEEMQESSEVALDK